VGQILQPGSQSSMSCNKRIAKNEADDYQCLSNGGNIEIGNGRHVLGRTIFGSFIDKFSIRWIDQLSFENNPKNLLKKMANIS